MNNEHLYENANNSQFINIENFRICQKGAFNCIIDRISNKNKTTSIVVPTRGGKSDIIRTSIIELSERNKITGAIVVAPNSFLIKQLTSVSKNKEMIDRYSIKTNRKYIGFGLENWSTPFTPNNEYFCALTTQMLCKNINKLCTYIKDISNKTNKPVLIFIDECHSVSEKNKWGETVPKLIEAGALIVLLTATPFREDNAKIHGFDYEDINNIDSYKIIKRTTSYEDSSKDIVEQLQVTKTELAIKPDYYYTFERAFRDKICLKPEVLKFDVTVNLTQTINNKEIKVQKLISEMTEKECDFALNKLIKEHDVISKGIEILLHYLNDLRKINYPVRGIVFCGNDVKEEDNNISNLHLKKVEKEIKRQDNTKTVLIATGNEENPSKIIENFVNGQGDILIVKQMGGVGLDCKELKVSLDLSVFRTQNLNIQRMMRTATIWKDFANSIHICPADVKSIRLIEEFLGKNSIRSFSRNESLLSSIIEDKKENESNETKLAIVKVHNAELLLVNNNSNDDFHNFKENKIFKHIAAFRALLTDEQLTNLYDSYKNKDSDVDNNIKIEDPSKDISNIQTQINEEAKKYTLQFTKYNYNKDLYGKKYGYFINNIKKINNIPVNQSLEKINSIEILNKILKSAKQINQGIIKIL